MSPVPPRLVVLTDRRMAEAAGHRLVDVVAAAVSAAVRSAVPPAVPSPGPPAVPPVVPPEPATSPRVPGAPVPGGPTAGRAPIGVLLREKDLARPARAALVADLRAALAPTGRAVLLVASDVHLAQEVGADGVHLAAADPLPAAPPSGLAIGRSCHAIGDLRRARADGVDYASLSPVFPTPSKPGHGPALGTAGLAGGCRAVPDLPVLALGGIGPGRAATCIDAGARGVAVMGEIMRATEPAAVVRRLLDELARPDERTHVARRSHA